MDESLSKDPNKEIRAVGVVVDMAYLFLEESMG